jgi:hypothetical protein
MKKTYQIDVRLGANLFGGGETVEKIVRKIYGDAVGNFNRFACRYKGRTFLVHSEAGDLGDPFRADESYQKSLFIQADKPCLWNL